MDLTLWKDKLDAYLDPQEGDMLRLLERIVNMDSFTTDAQDVDQLGTVLTDWLREADFQTFMMPKTEAPADEPWQADLGHVFMAKTHGREAEPGIVFLGHMDTVFPKGTAQARPQNDAEATLAPPLTKEQAHFGFDAPARRLHDLIRGLNPWPVAYFEYGRKKVKVLRTLCDDAAAGAPGEILSTKPLKVACASGALTLLEVVPEGSRPMEGSAWAAGRRFTNGDKLQ